MTFSTWKMWRNRKSQAAEQAQYRKRLQKLVGRRLTFERLEDRTLLSGSSISATQATALISGVQGLANFGTALDGFNQFAANLPVVDQAVGQVLNLQNVLQTKLFSPVNTYLAGASPTTTGLVSALSAVPGLSNVTDTSNSGELSVSLDLQASKTFAGPIDLGTAASQLGLSVDVSTNVTLTAAADFHLTFGFDKTAGLSANEQFFIRAPQPLSITATINAPDVNVSAKVGFVQVDIQHGTVALNGGLQVGFNNPDMDAKGNITLAELQGTTVGALVNITPSGSLTAKLPVHAKVGTFDVTGTLAGAGPRIELNDTDLFGGTVPAPTLVGFTDLSNFTNLTPSNVVGLLNQIGSGLQGLSSFLDVEQKVAGGIPFIKDKLDKVIDFTQVLTGFSRQLFDVVVAAPNLAPANGQFASPEIDFTLAYTDANGNHSVPVVVTQALASPSTNASPDDLVADINKGLQNAGIDTQFTAATVDGRLQLKATDSKVTMVTFTTDGTTNSATQIGFQTSEQNTFVFKFDTIQSLVTKLVSLTGLTADQIGANYDPASQSLTFHLKFMTGFDKTIGLDFSQNLSPLTVTGTVNANLHADVTLETTVGVQLTALTPGMLTGSADLPANGQLTGPATFDLSFNGNPAMHVTVPVDAASTSPTTLVADVNLALASAGLGSVVTASLTGNKLTLSSQANSMTLTPTGSDTGLHLAAGTATGNGLSKHVFLLADSPSTPSGINVNASIMAPNVTFQAALGFLGIGIQNGTAHFSFGTGLALQDPGPTMDGKVTLDELLSNPTAVPMVKPITVDLGAHLPIAVSGLTIPGLGTPAIDVSLATPNDPTSIQVTPNADFNNALKDFSHFSIQDVVNLLLKVVDFLKNQNINGLNTKLPLINKSVNDLLGLADKFGQAAQNLLGVNPTILAALKAAIGNVSQNAFAGDGSTTDYPLSFTPASTSDIQVLLDGTVASSGFSLNGSTLHFTSAPPKGQQINVKPVAAPTGADGTKTDFTLPLAPGTNFTPIVKVNGVQIEDFTVTGTTLSFKVAPASGATITVNYLDLATVITEVEKALPSDLVQSLQNAQETLKDVAALNPASITTLPQMLVSSIGTLIQLAQAASNSVDSILPSTSDARHDFDSLLSHLQSLIPSAQTLSDKLSRDLRLALGITDPNELTLTLSFPDIGVSPNHEQAVEAALHFKIDKTVSQPLDFNLNLSGTPVGLSSTGTINVDAGAEFNLDLGIDLPKLLSDPAHALYLRGSGTDLKLTAGIFNSTVSLTASLGAISAGLAGTILVAKPVKEDFTATDMQTDFPLTFNNADTDTTDTPANFFAIVKVNGAIKTNGTDFTITGKTLKFMSGLSASDAVEILYIPAAPADETPGGAVDGMNKTFTLSISPDAFNVTVKVNGMQLSSPADYSISGNTLTFVNAPASGATINVHYDNAPADVTLGLTNTGVNPLAGLDSSSFSFQIHAMAGGALAIHIPSGGSSIGALKVAADLSDFDLSHIQVSTPSGLLGDLTSGNFNLADMVAGLTALLHLLSDGLTSHVLASLPLIGNGLDKTGLFIEKILGSNFFMDLTALANPATLQADLQHLIFKYLGPGEGGHTGLDILADVTTGAKLTDFSQVGVTVGATSILVDLRFKGTDTLVSKNFGLGFDGLGLVGFHTMGQINVTVGYDIHFGFGLSKTDGFFFQLNTDNKPEIQLKLGVGFGPNTSITAKLFFLDVTAVDHGDSGFSAIVNLNIKDPNNDHKLTFKEIQASQLTDLIDTGSGLDGEQNPGDPGDFTGTGLGIDAKIDLDLQATINGDTSFPSLKAQLIVNWAFNTTDGLSGEAPHIQIKDVTLDFGTFLSKSIGPILAAIDSEIKPIKPLLDLLETKIPVISQLSELLGQGPVTFASAISALGEGGDTVVKVIHILDEIVTIADTATNTFQNSGELSLDFGNFSFGDATHDLRSGMPGSLTADQLNIDDPSVASGLAPKFTDVNGAKSALTGSKASQGASFLDSITGPLSDLGINLPLLSSPASIFKLFLGQDVDLVTWHLPEMKASFSFSYSFGPILPPIPLFVDLGGAFGIDLNLSVGLDTRGIRTGNFFNGFFFGTRDGVDTGNPQPVIDVFAQFTAGASLSIGVLSAGVDGGIRADIGASWHDPDNDGKLYIDELIANAQQGPECIFDLHGKFTAFLEAFVEVNLLFVHFRKDFTLVSITLFDFDVSCPPLPPPEPAHISDGAHTDANKEFDGSYAPAGVLVLNMGSHANLYQPGHSTDGDDTFKVVGEVDVNGNGIEDPNEDLDGVPGFSSHTVKVTGNGHDKVYTGVTGIYADGGAGKNKITLDASVLVPATLKAGDGGDVIQGGAADNHIYGGNGNDQLAGRDGNDTIYGGAGDDVIDGANGNNELHGGAGNDQLRGGTGNDTIYGDAGDDNIDGGAGDDHIYGGDGNVNTPQEGGNDQIKGGDGNDTIYGQGGPDNIDSIEGGAGADYIVGGQGNDMLIGDGDAVPAGMGGNDTIFGGTGNDTMIGGQGDNELHGGAGDDLMYGGNQDRSGTGNNLMYGDDGNDSMYGDAGKDSMYGGNNDDMMFAGPGNDYMEGGAGNDYMEGGAGNDKMIGGSSTASPLDPDGNDIMYGDNADGTGSGDDIMIGDNGMIDGVTLIGGAGNDQMFGGAGNDLMYGQGGDDVMQGGTGNDTMFGGAGNDVMLGQQGNDSMEGGAGSDVLQGGDNNDVLIGGGSDAAIASGAAGIDNANPDVGDSLIGGTGDDVIVGDNGNVVLDGSGHVLSVQTNPNFGNGPDSIFGGDGNDTIFGGGAGDNISGDSLGGTGNDVIIGDQGSLTVTGLTTTILARTSTVTGSGGDDAIFGSGGNDTILGGDGKDNITGDDGNDVILGDNGEVIQVSGIVTRVQTLDPQSGDNDTIDGGNGSDTVLGGTGSDRITGGSDTGNDILLGDNGAVVGNDTTDPTNRYNIFSTDPNSGGADTVLGGPGNEIMVGGSQGDSLAGNSGNDVIVGDNVYITRDSSGTVLRIATAFEDIGGNDTITTGTGADTAIGGVGDDSITGGSDTSGDILMGDNGVVVGNDGSAQANDIFSTAPTFGGSDTVNGGPGNDTVIGGSGGSDLFTSMPVGGDLLFGNAGDDIIIGDSAYITRDANYLVQQITTTFTGANSTTFADKGGNDTVQGGDGNDTILGGFGSDSLQGNAGNDVVLGDNGELDYVIQNGASVLVLITTNSPTLGADDSISGGAGNDSIMGGTGNDNIT
ncbi:MAG TPA: hypothetical protein VGY66_30445, partial [Gemmataceae bacterium]|nr:hypothetical protein [Gemmataceae bacterium]